MNSNSKYILEKFSPFYGNLIFVLFFLIVTYKELSFKIFFLTSVFFSFIFGYLTYLKYQKKFVKIL